MLDGESSRVLHAIQNILLILLSFAFLPFGLAVLALSYGFQIIYSITGKNDGTRRAVRPRRILVTGVGMTKGLTLARLFHESGHFVVGADFEAHGIPSPGRFSTSLDAFRRLEKPTSKSGASNYIQSLLSIILQEKIDLWVSCSGVASAVEDGEAKEIIEGRTNCKAIQFDIATTQTLHEKHTFMSHTCEIGLQVPETHEISRREDVEKALENAPKGRKFIMKTIGMNDQARGDMTLLPLETQEATKKHLDRLEISKKNQWILQQFIEGEEFCTHALIIKGKVLAFVACPSAELLMHYEALPQDSSLSQAMLKFTREYATKGGEGFTGHCSFDFLVEDPTASEPELYPIECNPRAHTAVALFNGTPAMVDAYLSILDNSSTPPRLVVPADFEHRYYWIGHDLVAYVLHPIWQIIRLQVGVTEVLQSFASFLVHVLTWKDGTYSVRDPLPWFVLYHVYWPLQFLVCLRSGRKWSRVNVSTLKMFEC